MTDYDKLFVRLLHGEISNQIRFSIWYTFLLNEIRNRRPSKSEVEQYIQELSTQSDSYGQRLISRIAGLVGENGFHLTGKDMRVMYES